MKKLPFNVSARTALLIGRQNFANAEGAVIELVKNCYDADSPFAIIYFNQFEDALYIIDNGEGMTAKIIQEHWMTIGTDSKVSDFMSGKKRVKSGEKGIGRFALDRLGRKCLLCSRTKIESEPGVLWQVKWEDFEKPGQLVTQIEAKFVELKKSDLSSKVLRILKNVPHDLAFVKNWKENTGTIIRISGLKDTWSADSIRRLFENLSVLTPPKDTEDFSIYLFSEAEPEKYGRVEVSVCDDYDYKLEAKVDEHQKVQVTLWRNELNPNGLKALPMSFFEHPKLKKLPQFKEEAFFKESISWHTSLEELIPGLAKDEHKQSNLSKIGSFDFTFYFIRKAEGRQNKHFPYKDTINKDDKRSQWLDVYGGIKIFRDGFRVRPYGEKDSTSFDWLDLGSKALSNPTVTRTGYGVRPYQVYGIVNISRVFNPAFQDKSGREGIQEDNIFVLFKEVLKELIKIFEDDRSHIMSVVKSIADEIDKKEKARQEADRIAEQRKKEAEKATSTPAAPIASEIDTFITAREADKEEIEELKEEQKMLRTLASTGLVVATFVHELTGLSAKIVPRTDDLKEILREVAPPEKFAASPDFLNPYILLEDMHTQDVRLKNWLDFALGSIKKSKRLKRKINLVEYLNQLQRGWKSLFERMKINLEMEPGPFSELDFHGFEIDLDSIFNNLFANSIDAFLTRRDTLLERTIKLSFTYDLKTGLGIHYQDSGPGLVPEIADPDWIFEPFNTTKVNPQTGERIGTGLGMWIVKNIVEEYKGYSKITKARPGFGLAIVLPLGE